MVSFPAVEIVGQPGASLSRAPPEHLSRDPLPLDRPQPRVRGTRRLGMSVVIGTRRRQRARPVRAAQADRHVMMAPDVKAPLGGTRRRPSARQHSPEGLGSS